MARILVVDDEAELAEAIRAILADEGYDVDVCADGKEALERLADGRLPDLVLTDVMMPRLSGLELLVELRKQDKFRSTPVILMSAVNPAKTRRDAKWNEFLKKPFELDALVAAVRKQLR